MKTMFALLLITSIWSSQTTSMVYNALKSNSLEAVDSALIQLETEKNTSLNHAYKGALLMKKAVFLKPLAKKIAIFKEGHKLLEAEIVKNPNSTEYRFLRLAIQENAPKILGYNQHMEEDKAAVIAHFKGLNTVLKGHIRDFSTQSSILHPKDLTE